MLKSFAVVAPVAILVVAVAGSPAVAQDKPGDQGTTTVVIKDDTTPKLKKGAKAVTDASITAEVKSRLMTDKVARHTSIDVDTKDHVVTVTGDVPTATDKMRIGQLVAHTAGVKSVVNNLSVTGAATGATGTSGTQNKTDDTTKIVIKDDTTPMLKKGAKVTTDASITTAVKTRLMADDLGRSLNIDVDTKDGVVTLTGSAPTAADKAKLGEIAAHTTGVKRVVNNLTVK